MAPNNLPAFAKRIDTTYVIGTSKSDAETIRQSSIFLALQSVAQVKIVAYPDSAFGSPVATHINIWESGVREAARRDAILCTNPADMIWADQSFGTISERLLAGKKAIYAMFVRVVHETFSNEILNYRDRRGIIAIDPRDMVEMTFRHLHPFHAAYLRDSNQFPFHAEYVYWPVHGEGMLMRSLATTVLAFHAREYSVNSQFSLSEVKNPDEVSYLDDSDEIFGVSLTPLLKDRDWYTSVRKLDTDEVGAWWIDFDGPAHRALAKTKFRFHSTEKTPALWKRAEQSSDILILQSLVAREIVRTARLLKKARCPLAASYVAAALYAARLRRHWRWRQPVSIFAPTDGGVRSLPKQLQSDLLTPGYEKDLIDFVLGHVVPEADAIPPQEPGATDRKPGSKTVTTANGRPIAIEWTATGATAAGLRVVEQIELPFGNKLYIVDGAFSRP